MWWYVVHPFVAFWRRVGGWQTVAIMMALGMAGVAALYRVRDALLLTDYGSRTALIPIAALLLTGSVSLALMRRRHLTTRILVGIPELDSSGNPGKLLDEGVCTNKFSCSDCLLPGYVAVTKDNVVEYGTGKYVEVLQDDTNSPSNFTGVHFVQVNVIEEDRIVREIVKSAQ